MADNYMTFNDAVEVLTPYAEKINTIKPESITWAAYQLLTSEQKAAKRYLITDYPSPTGYVNKLSDLEDVSINSQTLSNGQVPVYNSTNEVWENKTILENSLTSTATDVALTAAQGKVLQDTKQAKNLTTPLTINGTQESTVEGALGGLNDYGDALSDNLAANENVYGAKNTWDYTQFATGNGGFTQSNGVYTNTLTDTRTSFQIIVKAYDSNSTDLGSVINEIITGTGIKEIPASIPNNTAYLRIAHNGLGQDFTFYQPITQTGDVIFSFNVTSNDPTTVGGLSFTDVMLRDARVIDPTFAPYAKTNKQLTDDKAERSDMSTIHATGSTNSTGAQINAGTFFYLNGIYVKALLNIGTGDTFVENTNYKKDTVNGAIADLHKNQIAVNTSIDISSYTSTSNPFEVPADGYAILNSVTTPSGSSSLTIYGSDMSTSTNFVVSLISPTGNYQGACAFVRKGMYVVCASLHAGHAAIFDPLT